MATCVSSLHIHPIKSCASHSVADAIVETRGLRGDRRWMLVDADGRFVTGRRWPQLTRVVAVPSADGLTIDAPGMPTLRVPVPPADAPRIDVRVWNDQVSAATTDAAADRWFGALLGMPTRLVCMDAQAQRPLAPRYGRAGDAVSFADAMPLLLISQAALDGLNGRLAAPVSMLRFRPNVVVDGCAAHTEDDWQRLRIGAVEFEAAKSCIRCVFTTVDPLRGERDTDGEPLRTLLDYRRAPDGKGAQFGRLLIPRGHGRVAVGDRVTVLD